MRIPIVLPNSKWVQGGGGRGDGRKVDDKKKKGTFHARALSPPTLKTPNASSNRIPKAVIFRISVAFWGGEGREGGWRGDPLQETFLR
ncbi:hypothetical protein CDAR_461291 [Caerostris darwini]|uniref:Uncharacterized protein n=1 Tax=Caerostris darwini TaxID=1538125 RepID=A0AAV4SAH7_9ARAC|nr:hypothetical protein CDAR_461291 [Caerostris darwini]